MSNEHYIYYVLLPISYFDFDFDFNFYFFFILFYFWYHYMMKIKPVIHNVGVNYGIYVKLENMEKYQKKKNNAIFVTINCIEDYEHNKYYCYYCYDC